MSTRRMNVRIAIKAIRGHRRRLLLGRRADLAPEPCWVEDEFPAGWHGHMIVPVPAAGHLGVQEVYCLNPIHLAPSIEAGLPCPVCRAVV